MAVEIRNLQRTEIGEVAEYFARGQMGSSAVPVKRNPTKSERISSLARILRSQVGLSLENIPLWHERDLSNSANERFLIPMSIIICDANENTINQVFKILQSAKIKNELSMMQKISEIIQDTKVQIMQPLLAEEFITYARNLPLYGKIRGSDDMLRKHAIRDLALKIGVPEISARKRKKALQYGTLIHKNLIKSKLLRE